MTELNTKKFGIVTEAELSQLIRQDLYKMFGPLEIISRKPDKKEPLRPVDTGQNIGVEYSGQQPPQDYNNKDDK